jgi:type VI secretion system protein ImpA
MNARGDANPATLAAMRGSIATTKAGLDRIRNAFVMHGTSAGLENVVALVGKIQAFVDPAASAAADSTAESAAAEPWQASAAGNGAVAGAPTSLAEASEALAAIASYYSRREPSSPTLPLVRQAHQLIGKSFIEVISILVPTHMDKAAFQIGADQVFELPVGKLSSLSGSTPAPEATPAGSSPAPLFQVNSRSQAVALLEQVQRFFRQSEPSSPVPMLCDRARAFAERDFMAVLRDVLPKAALKNLGTEK